MDGKENKAVEIDEKKSIATIKDKALIEKLQALGGLLYEENKMSLIEAAYFAEKKVLALEKAKLIKSAKKKDKLAGEKYEVLKHLRDLGYIVRFSFDGSEYLRVYQKGFRPGEDRTKYALKVVKKGWKPSLKEIEEDISFANRIRKDLLYAYSDGEAVRFIKANRSIL